MGPALRARLEQRLGLDLGAVRVHTDSTAASSASQLGARAFAVGPHIFFAAGRFQPQTRQGMALLIHELVHVRQQPSGLPLRPGQLTETQHQAFEAEARAQAGSPQTRLSVRPALLPAGSVGALPAPPPGALPPVVIEWGRRAAPVMPLQQAVTDALPEAPLPEPAVPADTAPAAAPPVAPSPEKLAEQVYEWIQRRLRIEAERRGVQRWH